MTALQRLQHLIAMHRSLPVDQVTPEATLESLGIDSLGVIELVFEVEEAFDITLDATEASGLRTVRELAAHVERLVRPQPATRSTATLPA